MGFRIEYPLIEGKEIFRGEQEIEIFQSFSQKETFHLVTRPHVLLIAHIVDRRVPVGLARVFFERLKYRPTPLLIDFVARQTIHIVQGFDQFWPK